MKIDNVLGQLESIANKYKVGSEENNAVELAAKALLFAYNKQYEFQKYLCEFNEELSLEEKSFIEIVFKEEDD